MEQIKVTALKLIAPTNLLQKYSIEITKARKLTEEELPKLPLRPVK